MHRITCPCCRRLVITITQAYVTFNAEDAENFSLENIAQNVGPVNNDVQNVGPVNDNAQHDAQNLAPEINNVQDEQNAILDEAAGENHGWLVEDNLDTDNETDENSTDSDSSEEVVLPTWNLRIRVNAHHIRIDRARERGI